MNVLAAVCSNTEDERYALFCDDRGFYHGQCGGFVRLAVLQNIDPGKRVKMYYHFPYICVSERFGLNAAVVNIETGSVVNLKREDYHSDVSGYSIGFVDHGGESLLVHQTRWNRLDITNLATGQLLTEREIVCNNIGGKMEYKNFIDFFHSLLHVSPDGKHFLSNGWIWHPVGNIICFETAAFLRDFETGGKPIEYLDEVKTGVYAYSGYTNYDTLPMAFSGMADCDAFAFNEYGEISGGELHYNKKTGHLVVLSEKGAFELTLAGEIVRHDTGIKLDWQYDTIRNMLYRWNKNKVERKAI